MAAWIIPKHRFMTEEEVQIVLTDLKRRGKRSVNTKTNDIIFRLSTICGLRASEIANLTIENVRLEHGKSPYVRVVDGKGGVSGDVTIWDASTAVAFASHMAQRLQDNAKPTDKFVQKTNGKSFNRQEINKRFASAIHGLPDNRRKELSVHCGRHTAATMLHNKGVSLATVRDFCRHSNISVTNVYLHGKELETTETFE
jgi:integrase